MTDTPDDPGTDEGDPSWPADSFDRWLAALDITDTDPDAIDVPPDVVGSDVTDPWADVDLEPVDLTGDQRAYLLWHEDQPPVARLRGLDDDASTD